MSKLLKLEIESNYAVEFLESVANMPRELQNETWMSFCLILSVKFQSARAVSFLVSWEENWIFGGCRIRCTGGLLSFS